MADVGALLGQYAAIILSAILTAISFYASKKDEEGNRVPFEPVKLIQTVLTAFILGTAAFALFLTGVIPTPDTLAVEAYLATFFLAGPFSLLVQKWAQAIYRWITAAS